MTGDPEAWHRLEAERDRAERVEAERLLCDDIGAFLCESLTDDALLGLLLAALSVESRERMVLPDAPADAPWTRAGQDCLCPLCGAEYRRHPRLRVAGTYDPAEPEWVGGLRLRRLCSGALVKL